jgi:hypothetical protein
MDMKLRFEKTSNGPTIVRTADGTPLGTVGWSSMKEAVTFMAPAADPTTSLTVVELAEIAQFMTRPLAGPGSERHPPTHRDPAIDEAMRAISEARTIRRAGRDLDAFELLLVAVKDVVVAFERHTNNEDRHMPGTVEKR